MEQKRGTKIIEKIIQIVFLDLLLVFLPLIYFYRKNHSIKDSFKELGIKKIQIKELIKKSVNLIGILLAIAFLISIASTLIGVNDLNKVNEAVQAISTTSPALLFYYLTIRVFSEEIFFRGFLVKKTGVLFSSLIFGLAHLLYGSIIEIIGAFIAGLFLAYFYQKNNNLLPNIIGHMMYNAITLALVF
ncbi:CPBP family intramembrane metalloprotease [Candidatus Micrarchaeota archaeon]|nr:CPBP family intramembrane metalloprotease [Candidatus Micrarchaeota archaeon]MBU2476430.1 CPBP family intramembrane metalloprotease [Candidatus Micrarchaeota archaeon]